MAARSNIDEYEKLSKERLVELAKLYGRLGLALGGFWFLEAEKAGSLEEAVKMDAEVWRQLGKIEAKRLMKFLSMEEVTTPEEICTLYLLSPVWGNLGARAEVSGEKCYLSVTDCRPQIARRDKGLEKMPCKPVGLAFFGSFLSELNHRIRFRCLYCPPDAGAEESGCRWEVWFERS